jgi:hypothetical protein
MVELTERTNPLRIAAAVLLGIITGAVLFLIVVLVIGAISDMAHMDISVSTNIAENVFSLILLVALIIVCVGAFWWKVATTPPSEQ